jgi:Flp pilus assembly protein TadB
METSAIHASALKISNASRKSSLKKTSIKTSTTTTTTPSSESSQTVTETSTDQQNHSPSNSIRKQQKPTMKLSNLSSKVKSAIFLSWLLPILVAMCIPMIHQIIGPRSTAWWLEITSPDFIIFAVTESLLVFLFVLLFVTLLKHLIFLSRKYEKMNMMLKKR